jgi:hypothetical protein
MAMLMWSSELAAWWAVANEVTQGDERGAYVTLARLMLREGGIT